MKTMALNSVRNNSTHLSLSQMITITSNAIHRYGKCENIVATVAIACTLIVLTGVASYSILTMTIGTVMLILAITPTLMRWLKEDYERDF